MQYRVKEIPHDLSPSYFVAQAYINDDWVDISSPKSTQAKANADITAHMSTSKKSEIIHEYQPVRGKQILHD